MNPRTKRAPVFWWALVVLTVAGYSVFGLFPDRFFRLGVNHLGVWFLDTFAILASNDAVARGFDPYALNPLDYLRRPHIYSHWWLQLRHLGLTRAHTFPAGLVVGLSFLGAALAWLRPRSRGELAWYCAVLLSSPALLGFDRANNDLVIFVLLGAVVPCVRSPHAALRWLATVPIAIAAGLKFYPAAAVAVLLSGTDPRETRRRVTVALAVLVLVAIDVGPDFLRIRDLVPRATGLMTFSALHLFEVFGLAGPSALFTGWMLAAVAAFGFTRMRIFTGWRVEPGDRAWLGFVLGAVLLVGCFLTGQNYAYRWIFALWLAPLLWCLPRDASAPRLVRRFAGITALLLMWVLWADPLASLVLTQFTGRVPPATLVRWSERFFLIEQPIVWMFFWCLVGFLTQFATQMWPTLVGPGRAPAQAGQPLAGMLHQGGEIAQ